jgi:hypothetical protein
MPISVTAGGVCERFPKIPLRSSCDESPRARPGGSVTLQAVLTTDPTSPAVSSRNGGIDHAAGLVERPTATQRAQLTAC